jgi:hypothetical protein
VTEPSRNPVFCGALGRYDRAIVERVASALPAMPSVIHADRRACLRLDRMPLRWGSSLRRGMAWSERFPAPDPSGVSSWQAAACDLDACGLVVGPRLRAVHSSVSGAAPVYWADHAQATYFASSIDALARGVPGSFEVDWETWASMFALRQPLGEGTPFRQIRRLRAYSVLTNSAGAGAVVAKPWPWAEIETHDDVDAAADATVDALHDALAPLAATGAVVLLSGGLDSRVLLGAAHDAGISLRALTAVADDGLGGWEAEMAERAAAAAGAAHERFPVADAAAHRRLWLQHLEEADFQFIMGNFVMPMGPRLANLGLPALDGFALDTFGVQPGRSYDDEALDPSPGLDLGHVLWKTMQARAMAKVPERALAPAYADAAVRSTKRRFRREVERYSGSDSQALLSVYRTRGQRAIALLPMQGMGRYARVLTPCANHRTATALLSLHPRYKRHRALYRAILDRITSPSKEIPGVADTRRPATPPGRSPNHRGPEMVELYESGLRNGPLTPHLGRRLAAHVHDGTLAEGLRRAPIHRAAMVVTAFHLWAERYDHKLREIDPRELLELGGAGAAD